LLAAAKLGVLVASGLAAAVGLGLGNWLLPLQVDGSAAQSADEAEASTEL
jgi:hypothetical protein